MKCQSNPQACHETSQVKSLSFPMQWCEISVPAWFIISSLVQVDIQESDIKI